MDCHRYRPLQRAPMELPDPAGQLGDLNRRLRGADRMTETDNRVSPGQSLAVPGPPPADGDLDLDCRLEPIGVRSVEQTDFHQAHGRRSIWAPTACAPVSLGA